MQTGDPIENWDLPFFLLYKIEMRKKHKKPYPQKSKICQYICRFVK